MNKIDLSGAEWFKSSYSGSQGDCVEIAWLSQGVVGVRDSKNPTGPALAFGASEWASFTTAAADGKFGCPE
ncbi:DUF397 domain-containing protein [Nocardia crassostreae]|uniref:DUF397 domain-containing protein n=1 Tax=Nocardia crassostreae TaxID=53428 RepID=UPI000AE7636C